MDLRTPFKPALPQSLKGVPHGLAVPPRPQASMPCAVTTWKPHNGPSAGHARFAASFTSSLARTGQLEAHLTDEAIFTPGQSSPLFAQPWNARTPVWERQIPAYSRRPSSTRAPRGFVPKLDDRPSSTTTSDWSLLLSPRQLHRIRRPWPGESPPPSRLQAPARPFKHTLYRGAPRPHRTPSLRLSRGGPAGAWRQSTSRRPRLLWAGGGRARASERCMSTR